MSIIFDLKVSALFLSVAFYVYRTFAYCFKFLSANKKRFSLLDDERMGDYSVLVFASHYSLESRFHRLAADVVANIQRGPVKMQKMCRDLLSLRFSNSGKDLFIWVWFDLNSKTFIFVKFNFKILMKLYFYYY